MSNEDKNSDADLPKTEEGSNPQEQELSDKDLEQVSGGTGASAGRAQFSEFTVTKGSDHFTP